MADTEFQIVQNWWHIDTILGDENGKKVFQNVRQVMDIYIDVSSTHGETIVLPIILVSKMFSNLRIYTRNGPSRREIGYLVSSDDRPVINMYLPNIGDYPLVDHNNLSYYYVKLGIEYTSLIDTLQSVNSFNNKNKLCAFSIGKPLQPEYYITVPLGWRIHKKAMSRVNVPRHKVLLLLRDVLNVVQNSAVDYCTIKMDLRDPTFPMKLYDKYIYYQFPNEVGSVDYGIIKIIKKYWKINKVISRFMMHGNIEVMIPASKLRNQSVNSINNSRKSDDVSCTIRIYEDDTSINRISDGEYNVYNLSSGGSVGVYDRAKYYIKMIPIIFNFRIVDVIEVLVPNSMMQSLLQNLSDDIQKRVDDSCCVKIDMINPVVITESDGRYKNSCLPSKAGADIYRDVKDFINQIQIVYTLRAGGKVSRIQLVSTLFVSMGIILLIPPLFNPDYLYSLVSGFALVLSYGVLILAHYYTYLSMRHKGYFFINNKRLQRNIFHSLLLVIFILCEYLIFGLFQIPAIFNLPVILDCVLSYLPIN